MPDASSQRRTYAPEATRQAIIDSALALFEANGFHATSVQAVADEADVTKGAFYHHFRSKEELVRIIHGQLLDHMLGELARIAATVEGPAAQLRAVLRAVVSSTVRFRSHVAVYYQERRTLDEALRNKRDEMLRQTEAIVRSGIDDGSFRRDIDPHVATLAISGMGAWAHQWLEGDPERAADELADIVLGGLQQR